MGVLMRNLISATDGEWKTARQMKEKEDRKDRAREEERGDRESETEEDRENER